MKVRLLLVALVLLVANAAAQNRMTTADVPTEFMVNNILLPAGHYSIATSSEFRDTLIIRNTESGQAVLVPVRSVPLEQKKTCGENNLTYTQKDGRRVLHQVCFAGASFTFDLLHGPEVEEPATMP